MKGILIKVKFITGLFFITICLFVLSGTRAHGQIITTIAGNGTPGYSGDGGQATAAELYHAAKTALDDSGNVYIADSYNNVVRKVSALTGIITTIGGNGYGAGTNTGGYSGDGGPATAAELDAASGVAIDDSGNIYIADYGNFCVRKVTAKTGIISTVAGTPQNGGYSGDGGQATSAQLSYLTAVTLDDSDNLYISDQWNWVIREVSAKTGIITTIAGNHNLQYSFSGNGGPATDAALYLPGDVAVDDSGNVYIADEDNNEMRKVSKKTGIITDYAGSESKTAGYSGDGGPATAAEINNASGIGIDDSGNIYIADGNNQVIREVSAKTGIITTVAGDYALGASYTGDGGPATAAQLNAPNGVSFDKCGNFYIADDYNSVIRKVIVPSSGGSLVASATAPSICSGGTDTLTVTGGSSYTWSPATGLSTTAGSMVIATPTVNTTYTVNGTSTCVGAAIPDTIVVMVSVAPPLSVIQQPSLPICSGQIAILYVRGASNLIWAPTTGITDSSLSNDSVTVNPTVTTTYIVTGISNGCESTGTDTVTVIPAPPFTVLPSDTGFCSGQSAVLYVSGGGSGFVWLPASGLIDSTLSDDSVTVSPTATTTYTVTGINPSGCATSSTDMVTIIPSPNKPTFHQHGDTLISSSLYDNQWYRNDTLLKNDTSQDIIITIPGEYLLNVINEANGCSTSSDSMNIDSVAGLQQLLGINNQLSIYPNPFTNTIFIKINSSTMDLSEWMLQMSDVLGQTLYSKQSLSYSNNIDLSNLASGMYFITIVNKNGRAVFPVVKQH